MSSRDARGPQGVGPASQWIRGNALGLAAIFIALSGSAVAAQVAGNPGAEVAKKKVKRGPPGPAGPQGAQGPQGLAGPSTGPAGGSLTGSYPNPDIAPNAVGPGQIQNAARTVTIPLGSFVNANVSGAEDLEDNADGFSPGLKLLSNFLVLEWDDDTDGGGLNTADNDGVRSNFVVPQDYASGGSLFLRLSKDANAGVTERLRVGAFSSTSSPPVVEATITPAALTTYEMTPAAAYAPGGTFTVFVTVDDGSLGTTADDIVYLWSVEFRYTAAQ